MERFIEWSMKSNDVGLVKVEPKIRKICRNTEDSLSMPKMTSMSKDQTDIISARSGASKALIINEFAKMS